MSAVRYVVEGGGGASAACALQPVTVDLNAELQPPAHVIDQVVPRGVVTLLGAHGGAGKSVLALTLAAHVAAGHTWAGLGVDTGRALFVSLEDPGSLVNYRLRRIVDAYGLDERAVADNVLLLDGSSGDASLASELTEDGLRRLGFTAAMGELGEAATGVSLIVIDNASDAFDGNENDRRQVRGFVRALAQLAREQNAGLVLVAHVDKMAARNGAQGNTYSGSTAWHNSARSRLALIDLEGTIELRQEKANLGRPAEAIRLRWSDKGVLLPLGSAGAVRQDQEDAEAVLNALREAWAIGEQVSAARRGNYNTRSLLETFGLPKHLRGPGGSDAFWSALGKLQADGKVEVREVITSSRNKKSVLVEPGRVSFVDNASKTHAIPPQTHAPFACVSIAKGCGELTHADLPSELPTHDARAYRAAKEGE